jgi:carbon storage regulator
MGLATTLGGAVRVPFAFPSWSVGKFGREIGSAGEPDPVLVLTRKSDQSIMIGDDVEVTVLSVRGEKVRLGIRAPSSVSVHRKEIYLEIQEGEGRPARSTERRFRR